MYAAVEGVEEGGLRNERTGVLGLGGAGRAGRGGGLLAPPECSSPDVDERKLFTTHALLLKIWTLLCVKNS